MSQLYDDGSKAKVSILGPTLKFKGELVANEELVIQGEVEGKIKHSSNMKVGKEGRLQADVRAEMIVVEGTVEGDLNGRKAVVVKSGANVNGNISSPTVTLNEGSNFNGNIDMSKNSKAKNEAPPARQADSIEASQEPAANSEQSDKPQAAHSQSRGVA